ncbi:MAG: PAS domain S-box protein [Mariprofundaceae bacterium]
MTDMRELAAENKIEIILTDQFLAQFTMISILSAITSMVLCLALWQQLDTRLWLGWLAVIFISNVARIAYNIRYRRSYPQGALPEYHQSAQWHQYSLWLVLAIGLSWSIGMVLFMMQLPFSYQIFVIFFTAVIGSSSIASFSYSLIATRIFLLTLFLPIIGWLFLSAEQPYTSIGFMAVILLALLWFTANHLYQMLIASTALRFDNLDLIEMLERKVQENRKIHDIIENANDIIYSHDLEGRYTSVNNAVERTLGISKEEVVGASIAKLVSSDAELGKAKDMLQKKVSGVESDTTYEINVVNTKGDQRTMEVSSKLIHQDGKPYEIQGIARDITERKNAEELNIRLAGIVENAHDIIYSHDLHGVITTINPAGERLFKVPREKIIGGSYAGYIKPEDLERVKEMTRQKIAGESDATEYEVDFIDAEGGQHYLQVRSHVICSNGMPVEIQGIVQDITEERVRQEKLEHTQRLESLGVLAGGIAHDFNNILTTIMGSAALAEQAVTSNPEEAKKNLKRILEGAERSAQLCQQMLSYSGKGRFITKPLDLSLQVQSMGSLLEVSLDKRVTLTYKIAASLPLMLGDEAQLQQVIMNLITNANEAIVDANTAKGGVITLSTGVKQVDRHYLDACLSHDELDVGSYLFLEVSDNGCGMNQAVRKKMFDPFFTTKFIGRGLGMSAVLGIIHGHHGALHLTSEPKKGSTFTVLLPISEQEIQRSEKADDIHSQVSEPAPLSGKVLVVDDEPVIRELVIKILDKAGIQVFEACDGVEGVEYYQKYQDQISVVLLDMTMPKMNGLECYRELQRINPDVRVILSSGYSEEETLEEFAIEKVPSFIQKPYRPNALIDMIQRIGV